MNYQPIVDKIVAYVTNGSYKGRTYQTLANLVDTFGPRPSGSGVLESAIDFMLQQSRSIGLENVHTEDAEVPHWVRNDESAWMVSPRRHKLNILGLGSSVGTPKEGIEAEVLIVTSFDDLQAKKAQVPGKIVLYNVPFVTYGVTVQYRTQGAAKAGHLGAVAVLVRTVGDFSISSPHTGWQHYDDLVKRIPAACVTIEDANMMARMKERGNTIKVWLKMGAENYPNAVSRNTIVEVTGSELPNETVVISGHLDSWDVGQGAMDDGGGMMISWNAAVVLHQLNLRPRRTVRAILWTGEEQGLWGSTAYYNNHKEEKDSFQLMMESDAGTFTPRGLAVDGNDELKCIIQNILTLFSAINTTEMTSPMDGGPDIGVWSRAGVPSASLYNKDERYFWFHHSDGDTMDVEDPDTLDKCTALWASVAYIAADLKARLPRNSEDSLLVSSLH